VALALRRVKSLRFCYNLGSATVRKPIEVLHVISFSNGFRNTRHHALKLEICVISISLNIYTVKRKGMIIAYNINSVLPPLVTWPG